MFAETVSLTHFWCISVVGCVRNVLSILDHTIRSYISVWISEQRSKLQYIIGSDCIMIRVFYRIFWYVATLFERFIVNARGIFLECIFVLICCIIFFYLFIIFFFIMINKPQQPRLLACNINMFWQKYVKITK